MVALSCLPCDVLFLVCFSILFPSGSKCLNLSSLDRLIKFGKSSASMMAIVREFLRVNRAILAAAEVEFELNHEIDLLTYFVLFNSGLFRNILFSREGWKSNLTTPQRDTELMNRIYAICNENVPTNFVISYRFFDLWLDSFGSGIEFSRFLTSMANRSRCIINLELSQFYPRYFNFDTAVEVKINMRLSLPVEMMIRGMTAPNARTMSVIAVIDRNSWETLVFENVRDVSFLILGCHDLPRVVDCRNAFPMLQRANIRRTMPNPAAIVNFDFGGVVGPVRL